MIFSLNKNNKIPLRYPHYCNMLARANINRTNSNILRSILVGTSCAYVNYVLLDIRPCCSQRCDIVFANTRKQAAIHPINCKRTQEVFCVHKGGICGYFQKYSQVKWLSTISHTTVVNSLINSNKSVV